MLRSGDRPERTRIGRSAEHISDLEAAGRDSGMPLPPQRRLMSRPWVLVQIDLCSQVAPPAGVESPGWHRICADASDHEATGRNSGMPLPPRRRHLERPWVLLCSVAGVSPSNGSASTGGPASLSDSPALSFPPPLCVCVASESITGCVSTSFVDGDCLCCI